MKSWRSESIVALGFPRIRELPKEEQEPFREAMQNKEMPWLRGIPENEQDGFWLYDYARWKNPPT